MNKLIHRHKHSQDDGGSKKSKKKRLEPVAGNSSRPKTKMRSVSETAKPVKTSPSARRISIGSAPSVVAPAPASPAPPGPAAAAASPGPATASALAAPAPIDGGTPSIGGVGGSGAGGSHYIDSDGNDELLLELADSLPPRDEEISPKRMSVESSGIRNVNLTSAREEVKGASDKGVVEKGVGEKVVSDKAASEKAAGEKGTGGSEDSSGIFSSLVNAAHNAANIISSSMENDTQRSAESKKDGRDAKDARDAKDTAKDAKDAKDTKDTRDIGANAKDKDTNAKDSEEKTTLFSHKLDFLLKPAKTSKHSTSSVSSKSSPNPKDDGNLKDEGGGSAETADRLSDLGASASNVQFESVRESPVTTLGNGNLSLDHFKDTKSLRKPISPTGSSENLGPSFRRSLSPNVSIRQASHNGQVHSPKADSKSKRPRSASNASLSEPTKSITDSRRLRASDLDGNSVIPESTSLDDQSVSFDQGESVQEGDGVSIKYASKKRNQEFHQIFKKISADEKLVNDFSCALSKDILVQGRMYLSEHYICFNSNILGWVTNLVIPLQEVIQIEKKSTAVLFPNGIVFKTLHRKYVFATFLSRDSTFALINNVWHNVLLGTGTIEAANKKKGKNDAKSSSSKTDSNYDDSDDGDDVTIDSTDDDDLDDQEDGGRERTGTKGLDSLSGEEKVNAHPENNLLAHKGDDKDSFNGFPVAGPKTHAPTQADHTKEANETFITEELVKAPLGVVYYLLFGADRSYMVKILKNQKNFDITENTIGELSNDAKERNYSYIKPLNGPIGPKQTKCLVQDKLVKYDLDSYILVEQSTSTPDVPSGNSFKVRTKMLFSWGANNTTKVHVTTMVEWSGKSWIKGAIEKGSIDGQKESMKILIDSLVDLIKVGGSSKVEKKKKKRKKSVSSTVKQVEEPAKPVETPTSLQRLKDFVSSVGETVSIPMLSQTMSGSIVILVCILVSFQLFHLVLRGLFASDTSFEHLSQTASTSMIKINNGNYYVIPTIETYLNDPRYKMRNELHLWRWVKEKSDGKIDIKSLDQTENYLQGYNNQELNELVRITQLKLNEIKNRINFED